MTDFSDMDDAGSLPRVDAIHADTLDTPWRTDRRAQLVQTSGGVLTVRTETGLWVVPPAHALWLPGGIPHRLSASHPVHGWVLFIDGNLATSAPLVPAEPGAMKSTRLVDALLETAAELPGDRPHDEAAARLMQVLLDRLPSLQPAPLGLIWPRDPRARRIADTLAASPADSSVLDTLAETAGVTGRTAARLFTRETTQTFGQWRQRLRLLIALERLGGGEGVTQAALGVGYNDVSSFIAVFRDAFDDTPARYFR